MAWILQNFLVNASAELHSVPINTSRQKCQETKKQPNLSCFLLKVN